LINKLKKAKGLILPFLINFLSLFLFWLADVVVLSKYDTDTVSKWALLKSIIFISGSFITLGIDQAIVRLNLSYKDTLLPAVFQIFLLTSLTCAVLWLFGFDISYVYAFVILFCYATILVTYSFERSKLNYSLALIIFNFWRIIFYLLIVAATYKLIEVPLTIALLSSMIFLYKPLRNIKISSLSFKEYKPALKTGFYFFLSTCSLNIILFIDQLLINGLGDKVSSEIFFSHVTFFISPFAAFLGFTGFLLTPYLRENKKKAFEMLRKYLLLFIFAGILAIVAYYFFAGWLFSAVKKKENIHWLGIILSGILFARYLLLIPSSYFGAFGDNKLIRKVSVLYNVINVVYLGTAFILFYILKEDILFAISVSLLLTWTLRALIGYKGLFELKRNSST